MAVSMNIIGVKKVMELCKELKNLEIFVHVSTAYANCDRLHISEEVYNPPVKPEKLIEAVEWIEEDLLGDITPKVIKLKPNTYTYTKAVAESLVIQEMKDLPCAIVPLFPATGTGLLKTMLGNIYFYFQNQILIDFEGFKLK